jgi:hypothetical protein
MAANLKYYASLGKDVDRGYAQDESFAKRTAQDLIRMAVQLNDENLKGELVKLFEPYGVKDMPIPGMEELKN